MNKIYLTTAIPYANAAPHIGTAIDYLYGDILLRYYLMRGAEAKLSIGTDEHGSKIERKADGAGISPQQLVDNFQTDFKEMRNKLDLNFGVDIADVHKPLASQPRYEANIINIRTTDPDHVERVQLIWQKLMDAGVIYKDIYKGWYCNGCEAFINESDARAMDYNCPDHKAPLEQLSEPNYYLAVSKYTNQIKKFIKDAVVPSWRGKELLELVKDGARDVSISRPKDKLKWGIIVPNDPDQVMYVWVDALANYLTGLGYPDSSELMDYWPAHTQIIGKDIIRFHAIIWPTILLALDLPLPRRLMVHGFINSDGQKMSKSIGNVVSPIDIIDGYGVDSFRYYFTRHVPTFDDGDFSWNKFEAAYNGELANDLGNLVMRVASMINKYFDGGLTFVDDHNELKDAIETMHGQYTVAMDKADLCRAIESVFTFIHQLNQYIDQSAPWKVAKGEDVVATSTRMNEIFSTLVGSLLIVAEYLAPFLPCTAQSIHDIYGGHQIPDSITPLFPKVYNYTENK